MRGCACPTVCLRSCLEGYISTAHSDMMVTLCSCSRGGAYIGSRACTHADARVHSHAVQMALPVLWVMFAAAESQRHDAVPDMRAELWCQSVVAFRLEQVRSPSLPIQRTEWLSVRVSSRRVAADVCGLCCPSRQVGVGQAPVFCVIPRVLRVLHHSVRDFLAACHAGSLRSVPTTQLEPTVTETPCLYHTQHGAS
jgi:hypothetical protein